MEFITQLFPEEILYAIGWTVVHSLWQAFIVSLLLSAYLLGWQKGDARKRYLAGNLSLLLTFLLAFGTFFYYLKKAGITQVQKTEVRMDPGELLGWYNVDKHLNPVTQYFNEHLPLIVTAWMIGMIFLLLKMMGGLLYIQRLKRRYIYESPACWQERISLLSAQLRLNKTIRLAESALIKVPVVLGWLKPMILMPVGAINHLTPEQTEAILAHELAHIARHDYLLNILQSLVEILFYFNPAVWWISANIRTERENCCDDIAVRLCGNSIAYARALVSLQEMHQTAPAFAMPFSKSKNQLLLRIQRILNQSQNKSNAMEKLSATFLLLTAVLLLSVQANTPFGELLDKVVSKKAPADVTEIHLAADGGSYRVQVLQDTVPKSKNKTYFFRHSDDDEDVEITLDKNNIISLKVNGEEIPKENYGEYERLAEELMLELENMPIPPVPPVPPVSSVPPIPPIPPVPAIAPTMPAPPSSNYQAGKTRKIITEKNGKDRTTFIIETAPGEEPVKIELKEGKKGSITINGQKIKGLKKGDKTVIIEPVPGEGPGISFWNGEGWKGNVFVMPEVAPLMELQGELGNYALTLPRGEQLFVHPEEGMLAVPELHGEWNEEWRAEHEAMMEELRERMKDGNLSKEWMEDFNREMQGYRVAPEMRQFQERDARLMEEGARELLKNQEEIQQNHLELQEHYQQELENQLQRQAELLRKLEKEQKQKSKPRKQLMSYSNQRNG